LIGGSKNSDYQGNLSKALLFYHLINGDNLILKVNRNSKRLRDLMHCVFEFSLSHLENDLDGKQRLYFREPISYFNNDAERIHRKIIEYMYQEFLR